MPVKRPRHPLNAPLTKGEISWLARKQRHETQREYRTRHHLTAAELREAETDPAPSGGPPPSSLDWPSRLRLARRRSGLRLRDVARCLGVTTMTVLTWEREGDQRMIRFWSD